MEKHRVSKLLQRLARPWTVLAFVAVLAGALALTFAGLTAAQAQTETEVTLVSNTGQPSTSLDYTVGNGNQLALAFRTGANPGGYTLTKVDFVIVDFGGSFAASGVKGSIYTAKEGLPYESLYTLIHPSPRATGTNTFTAPAGSTLDSETKYFLVFKGPANEIYHVRQTLRKDEDDGKAEGWSIDNEIWQKVGGGDWAVLTGLTPIAIKGQLLNAPPAFGAETARRFVSETVAPGEPVGAPVAATDADGDNLTYTLEGPDKDKFTIDSSGQIRTLAQLDREAQATHSVTVKADDGNDGTATIDVTIIVSEVDPRTLVIRVPTLRSPHGSTTSLFMRWRALDRFGGPAVTGYEVQYRQGDSGEWKGHAHSGIDAFTEIGALTAGTQYQARVRASFGVDSTQWSEPGTGTVSATVATNPSFGIIEARIYQVKYIDTIPRVHFGEPFEVKIRFTEGLLLSEQISGLRRGRHVMDLVGPERGISVTGGRVVSIAECVNRSLLKMVVEPSGHGAVTLTLEPMPCDEQGALCADIYPDDETRYTTGLQERASYTVRGVGTTPPAPADLRVDTTRQGDEDLMEVSFVGTDEAIRFRVQWKFPDQEWSEAQEWSNWRTVGPGGRQLAVRTTEPPGLAYDIRARWESPVGDGPWAYALRQGVPRTRWGETIIWYHTGNNAEVRISYQRDLDRDSRLDGLSHSYPIAYSESRAIGYDINGVSVIDDDQGRPRVVKLELAKVQRGQDPRSNKNPHSGETVWVTHNESQVISANPPGVKDQDGNPTPPFSSIVAKYVSNVNAPRFSVDHTAATEGPGATADFTVTRSGSTSETVKVDYATTPYGTATPDADYTSTFGTLTFHPGQASHTVRVPVADDAEEDDGETFWFRLTNPVNENSYIANAWAVGTIHNEDPQAEDAATPLTAEFAEVPAEHTGENFTFVLNFSEEPDISYKVLIGSNTNPSPISVTNGRIASVSRRVSGENRSWNISIRPSGDDDVTIALAATTNCEAQNAICTEDDRKLSNSPETTVPGPASSSESSSSTDGEESQTENTAATGQPTITGTAALGEILTTDTSGIADADGLTNASFSYQWLRIHDGAETEISDATASTYDVVLDDAAKSLKVRVSFTDDDGFNETATSAAVSVPQPDPMTGDFRNLPSDGHDGSDAFTLRVGFNYPITIGWEAFRDHAFTISGGSITAVKRVDGRSGLWRLTVDPDGSADVTISLAPNRACDAQGAICNEHGMMLSNEPQTTISGPSGPLPQAPSSLTHTVNSDRSVTLSWTAPDDDSVTGYQILRRRPRQQENELTDYAQVSGKDTTTYTDTKAPDGELYVYRVQAINPNGRSTSSNYVNVDK